MASLAKILSFRLDYKTKEEVKNASIYFFLVAFFIFLFSLLVSFPLMRLAFKIGATVYLLASIYFFENYIEKSTKRKFHYFFSIIYSLLIFFAASLLVAPIQSDENRIISFFISVVTLILPASFSDEIISFMNKQKMFLALSFSNLSLLNINSTSLISLSNSFIYEHMGYSFAIFGILFVMLLKYIKEFLKIVLLVLLIAVILKYLGVL